jgi:hypothetical protein
MFENRAVRKIFGPKGKKMAGGWKRQHNEERHNLNSSANIIMAIKSRRRRWAGTCSLHGRDKKCIQYFGWKI